MQREAHQSGAELVVIYTFVLTFPEVLFKSVAPQTSYLICCGNKMNPLKLGVTVKVMILRFILEWLLKVFTLLFLQIIFEALEKLKHSFEVVVVATKSCNEAWNPPALVD